MYKLVHVYFSCINIYVLFMIYYFVCVFVYIFVLLFYFFFVFFFFFFFSSRRRHTRCSRDWSSDVCSSDLLGRTVIAVRAGHELLGTIWACVKQPLPEAKEQMLVDVTRLVAVQWLRDRKSVV